MMKEENNFIRISHPRFLSMLIHSARCCKYVTLIIILLFSSIPGQNKPSPIFEGTGGLNGASRAILWDQMDNPGNNSITSQNFETANDIYDSFAADDFAFMDETWSIGSIEVAGVYYNGTGPASSVNVWIYSSDGLGGLPENIIYTALNVIPSAGLAEGSFTIDLPDPVVLTEGWYWLCVQANMNSSEGQWGWTGRTVQSFSESAWMNPGGGFGTPCTPSWGFRVTDCGVGTNPDNCFRLNGDIIPVELISFTAKANGSKILLNWSTATELNNYGFDVQRSVDCKEYGTIGFVKGFGTTAVQHEYSFADKNINSGKYYYRLKQIDLDGSHEYSKVVEAIPGSPSEFSLDRNYPNPFNPTTKISWQLPLGAWLTLKVYDILGREVASLIINEYKPAGEYEIEFDASSLPGGIYIYRLCAGSYISVKKMILLK
jgi:hypothetical protein